ncbi:MAG: diphthine synthase [Candidatus Methanomethylophilaceae archaeon]|nr:diphthine synthase [Candidatus Methanomethylophilaceae archaeon]MDI3542142.1 diphthine synthase [Candidatus Methanomethylophilaceae archaeon]
MGELLFVGLGLSGVDGMTVKALRELQGCDIIYGEFYTSNLLGAGKEELEEVIGKKVILLDRSEVEETEKVIEAAKERKVAFVTAGDTMAATTHIDLRIRAKEEGIATRLIHGVSVFSACPSSLGLQPYKFGRTITLPFRGDNWLPRSPYDHLVENKKRGLHSLVLLDIRAEEGRYMSAKEGIEWILAAEDLYGEGLLDEKSVICVASRIGSDDEMTVCERPRSLLSKDLGKPLHSLVIPGTLHFMEAYALVSFAGAPIDIIEDDD